LGLPSATFPQISPLKPYTRLSSPFALHALPISFSILSPAQSWVSSTDHEAPRLWSFLRSPLTSSLLCPNIFLNILFLNTLSLRSSLNVSGQVSHPHQTGKIIVLYILIFGLLDNNLEHKRFCTEW
jgi:hypothetical protein